MLAVALGAACFHVNVAGHQHLHEKDLVLVQVVDPVFERAHRAHHLRARQQSADAWDGPWRTQPRDEKVGRPVEPLGRHAELRRLVTATEQPGLLPASPVFRLSIHHDGFRMTGKKFRLVSQLVRQKHVIRVEERQVAAACLRDAEIARCALAAVGVPRMLEVAHFLGTRAAYRCAMAVLPSFEPSSISRSSNAGKVCARTLSIASSMN
jgi:hypothetical protein